MTKVMTSLPTSLLIFLAIEQMDMGRDVTAFRERFKAYKNGKSVSEIYDAGLPRYANGTEGNIPAYQRFVEEMGPVLFNEMIAQGVKNPKAAYKNMITQLAYESNYGQSRVAREQNNFGGVGWNGKTYTTYKDKADFAKNYVRLMNSRYKNVIGADTLAGYAKGLKSLNYYGDTVENYTRNLVGMKSFAKALNAHMSNNPDLYNQQIPAQEPSPYIAKPVSTEVRPTIPAEQTVPAYDTKISPYISGKPMVKLRPRVQLPNLIELMEDSEWEPGFPGLKNGKLPGYKNGKTGYVRQNGNDIKFDEDTGELVDQVTGERGTLMLPEINITRANPNNYRSYYDPNAVINGFNAFTLGGLNNIDPTQWARRVYDLPKTIFGPMRFSTYMDRWINGNEGVVSSKFTQEHPYYSMLFNAAGDGLIGASAIQSARVLNQLRPQNLGKHFYYNVNPQGYDNIIKQAKGIAKTVLKGSEPDIENPIWDTPGAFKTAASEYGVPEDVFRKARIDAWRMHTNIPQKYNTFTPSKRVSGAYTAERDVARMMEPDILEDENIIKMLKEDKGVGIDFFNGSGGNVGFVNYDLGRTLNGDKLGVLVTDDVWDIQPFSRINQGNGLGSRLTEHTTQKILKKILPIKSKVTNKLDNLSYNDDVEGYKKWAAQHPDEAEYVDPREVFSTERKIKPVLDFAIKTINKGTTKISDFDRWLRKTLNNKAKNFEVGSLYKGSPFRVINEFPYTRALNVDNLGQMNPGAIYSYWGGFDTKNILPTLAHDYHLKGILPVNVGDNIPSQLKHK